MNEQTMKFRFGVFVLAVLILLAVLAILFGGVPRYFAQSDPYTIIVDNAQNVTPGTPVRRSGVKIGEVRSVELDKVTGKVRITILIDHGYTIYEGDRPTIMRGVLGGDVTIDFLPPPDDDDKGAVKGQEEEAEPQQNAKPGDPPQPPKGVEPPGKKKQATRPPLPPGSEIPGFPAPETQRLVQRANELLPPARASLNEMEKVLRKVDKLMPLFEDTLREFRAVAKSTNRMVPEVARTNDELRELAKSVRVAVPDLKKTNEEFQVTARVWGKLGERLDVLTQTNEAKLTKLLDQLTETTRRLAQVVSEENQKNLELTLKNAAETTRRLTQMLSEENQKNLNLTLKNAAETTGRVNQVLTDENVKNINQTLKNARLASEQFDSISKNTDEMIKDARVTIKNLNSTVIKADDVFGNLQKVTGQFSSTSPGFMKSLNESSSSLNLTLREFRELMREFARSEGTIQKLMTDPSLYNNLNESACMVTRLLPRVDRILGDMEVFTDKLARHPELLGIGGVVRPSNGLKAAPTVLPWQEPTEPRWRIWPH